MLSKNCKQCNKQFFKSKNVSLKEWNNLSKFCSMPCYRASGRKTLICKKCGISVSLIKYHADNREFCSQKCSNKDKNYIQDRTLLSDKRGRRNHKYRIWRLSVLKRDQNKCKMSNADCTNRLEVHHILPYAKFPELRLDINNGITLCRHHHPLKEKDEIALSPYFKQLVEMSNKLTKN